jgi:hypothetical protein
MMRRIGALIVTAALASAAATTAAAADPKAKPLDFTVRQETTPIAPFGPLGMKILKWDARKGRWGLTLNLEQPDVRPATANDVQAGAYYKLTPSVRVGGAVALGDQRLQPGPRKPGPDEGQPRVRLETTFKF